MENDLQCLSGRLERAIVKVKNEQVFTCPSNHLWPLPTPLVVAGGVVNPPGSQNQALIVQEDNMNATL